LAAESPFDMYSDEAKKVLQFAQEEAQRLGHSYIGTEHLLLGLIRDDTGVAGKVLREKGFDPNKTRVALGIATGGQNRWATLTGITPLVMNITHHYAPEEARQHGQDQVGTAHLLLALLRDDILLNEVETTGDVLRLLGFVDLAVIRSRALQELG
jgi:ATP-dependent Clp protease ATP-binding subunit ClpC